MSRSAVLSSFLLVTIPDSPSMEAEVPGQIDPSKFSEQFQGALDKMEGRDNPAAPETWRDAFQVFSSALECDSLTIQDKLTSALYMANLHLRGLFKSEHPADRNAYISSYSYLLRSLICIELVQGYKARTKNKEKHTIAEFSQQIVASRCQSLMSIGSDLSAQKIFQDPNEYPREQDRTKLSSQELLPSIAELIFFDPSRADLFSQKIHLYICALHAMNIKPLQAFKPSEAFQTLLDLGLSDDLSFKERAKAGLYSCLLALENKSLYEKVKSNTGIRELLKAIIDNPEADPEDKAIALELLAYSNQKSGVGNQG